MVNKALIKGQFVRELLSYNLNRSCEAYKDMDSPLKKGGRWSSIFERIPKQGLHSVEGCQRFHSRGDDLFFTSLMQEVTTRVSYILNSDGQVSLFNS